MHEILVICRNGTCIYSLNPNGVKRIDLRAQELEKEVDEGGFQLVFNSMNFSPPPNQSQLKLPNLKITPNRTWWAQEWEKKVDYGGVQLEFNSMNFSPPPN